MSTLLIQGASAAVGFVIGGPTGAQVGWAAGGVIANAFGPATELAPSFGPRLGDLKIQAATYGLVLPKIYGTARVAGNIMWTTDIIETATTETVSQGGKGGGGTEQEQTTYSYSQSFAVGICRGPITGIRRIWANGKLIYSLDADADAGTVASTQALPVTFYLGDETQTASSLQESYLGAGNVPAYRGVAYAEFADLPLAEFGNRTPNLEFEVVTSGVLMNGDATSPDFELISSASTVGGNLSFTISADADIVIVGTGWDAVPGANDVTDDLGNRYQRCSIADNAAACSIFYKTAPVSGAATIATLGSGTSVTWAMSFRGLPTGSPDVQNINGATSGASAVTTLATGNVTPQAAHTLSIAAFGSHGDAGDVVGLAVDNAFVLQENVRASGAHYGGAGAYLLDGPMSAINPTWTWTGPDRSAAAVAVFSSPQFASLTPSPVLLSDIVSDLCQQSNLSSSDINVVDLTTTYVDGYVVGTVGPIRGAIEPLASAYHFDAVESDNTVKFVLRGAASAVTVAQTDLAAHAGGDSAPEPTMTTREEETDLPVEVNVNYMALENSYQQGTQRSRSQATDSKAVVGLSFPIVMDDDLAVQIADATLFALQNERETIEFQTGRKHAKYEPTDVMTVQAGGVSRRVRITGKDEGANGVISWTGVVEDSAAYVAGTDGVVVSGGTIEAPQVYSQTGTGAPMAADAITSAGSITAVPDSVLELLDIPLLRDVDDDPGYYVATCGDTSAWRGAQVYRSTDGGTNYSALSNTLTTAAATIGAATTALGFCSEPGMFDEGNSVTVQLEDGLTLASATRAEVLNGSNAAALGSASAGWEIIQFRTATQVSPGVAGLYTLTGLLRGRLGTERFMGGHAVGDRFVLLDTNIRTVTDAWSNVGSSYSFKAVSVGQLLADATAESFTDTAVRMKPLAPVFLKAYRDANGDWQISWVRQTRLQAFWRDGVDAPLGETTEAYEIDVYSGSPQTVVRTISATTQSASYTSTQHTTDFGSPSPSSISIAVYQLSSEYGRGYAVTGTFS